MQDYSEILLNEIKRLEARIEKLESYHKGETLKNTYGDEMRIVVKKEQNE